MEREPLAGPATVARCSAVTHMTALGIAFIDIGAALFCVGLIFWLRARRNDPAGQESPNEFRPIIDALEEEDRRSSDGNRD
jgi:hypothetical protein